MCIFESDTVKSDPMQENYEIFKDLIQMLVYFISLTVCSGDIKKKKKKKKNSENDQSTGYFQSFCPFFLRHPNPKSEKKFPYIN